MGIPTVSGNGQWIYGAFALCMKCVLYIEYIHRMCKLLDCSADLHSLD